MKAIDNFLRFIEVTGKSNPDELYSIEDRRKDVLILLKELDILVHDIYASIHHGNTAVNINLVTHINDILKVVKFDKDMYSLINRQEGTKYYSLIGSLRSLTMSCIDDYLREISTNVEKYSHYQLEQLDPNVIIVDGVNLRDLSKQELIRMIVNLKGL